MPSEVAAADTDNLDLATMPATFDYEGDKMIAVLLPAVGIEPTSLPGLLS